MSHSSITFDNDFSLCQGGLWHFCWKRVRLAGGILVPTLVAWVPLLALSFVEGNALGNVKIPFLFDLEMHLRLLVALPLLIGAEAFANKWMKPIVEHFVARGLVPESSRGQFDEALAQVRHLRDAKAPELALIIMVYFVALFFAWRLPADTTWFGVAIEGQLHRTMAGWWLGFVSLPIFQFLLLRWYYRLVIWAVFLWKVARLDLRIMPMHPDRCGGLGFLSLGVQAFAPLLLAQGILLSGMMANRIFYEGASLPQFKMDFLSLVGLMMFAVLGPQLVFSPKLVFFRRTGELDAGLLAQQYVTEFDSKWLHEGAKPAEPLIGSADIQSLADLGNSFEVVKEMRITTFTLRSVLQLALTIFVPVLPLALTMFSMDQVFASLLKMVF